MSILYPSTNGQNNCGQLMPNNKAICTKQDILTIWSVCIVLFACSSCSNGDELYFKSANEALGTYRDYLKNIQHADASDTDAFCKVINTWREISDTVYHYLMKDSAFIKDLQWANQYVSIHDSIRFELLRLTGTWQFTYEDVLRIKEQTSVFRNDRELHEAASQAQPLFLSLDSIPIEDGTIDDILRNYRKFLWTTKMKGIHSMDEMFDFICKEDIMFRSFLPHLYEMENESLADITQETENICRNIFQNGGIPKRDAMVYMSMRTVRRLLQNSMACISDIMHRQMKSKVQERAYLWMIIQPFISIDQFSIATLTPQNYNNFSYIISQLPKSIKFVKTLDKDLGDLNCLLPQQLLKMYVLTL